MRLVSSNSDADLSRKRELAAIATALRALAANILRVIRGAGRAGELPDQAVAFIDACINFKEATGNYPFADDLERMLALDDLTELLEKFGEAQYALYEAEHTIIRGALQVVASNLVGQRTQATTGGSDMVTGIRDRELALKELNKQRQSKMAERNVVPRRSTKKSRAKNTSAPHSSSTPEED